MEVRQRCSTYPVVRAISCSGAQRLARGAVPGRTGDPRGNPGEANRCHAPARRLEIALPHLVHDNGSVPRRVAGTLRTHERIHVTRNGRDFVVLMAKEDLDSLEATLELLSDSQAVERVRQAERDIAAGAGTTADEIAKLMRKRRAGPAPL